MQLQLGYLIDEKRKQKEWFQDLLIQAGKRGFLLVPISLETDFHSLDRKLDVLIHKAADILVSQEPKHKDFVRRLEEYIKRNPWMCVIDPLESVKNLLDRKKIKMHLDGIELKLNDKVVRQGRWDSLTSLEEIKNCHLNYPLVYKPVIADGTEGSHEIGVAYNSKGLEEVASLFPIVCEEFVDHNATLIKVYVMGSAHAITYRRSVNNLTQEQAPTKNHESFGRISSQNANKDSPIKTADLNGHIVPLVGDLVNSLTREVSRRLGVNFYGIDIVQDIKTGTYYILDINYLPGFYDLTNVGSNFLDFIIRKIQVRFNKPAHNLGVPPAEGMNRHNTLVVSDIDGTIAPKGGHVSLEMRNYLLELQKKVSVGLITGGTLVRTKERLGDDVIKKYDWIFTENSIVTYKGGSLLESKNIRDILSIETTNEIVHWALNYLSKLKLPILRGTFVDFRTGLINISPAGRFHAPLNEKEMWVEYDKKHNIRTNMVTEMKKVFGHLGLEWVIGGDMGFDIFPKGWDKSSVLRFAEPFQHIFYFGDHTNPEEFGNDFPLFSHARTYGFSVDGPEETKFLLDSIFFPENNVKKNQTA